MPETYDVHLICLPFALATDRYLSKTGKVTALGLVALADAEGIVHMENVVIGAACGISPRDVQEGLHALEQAGWIARDPQVRGFSFRTIRLLWLVTGAKRV